MIILRKNAASNLFEKKLESQNILDYEIADEVSEDSISVTKDLKNFKIYLPLEIDYYEHELSDVIHMSQPSVRTLFKQEYDISVLTATGPITESTFFKILKKVIELEGFVTIIDEE